MNSVLISVKNQRDYLHSVWCESRSDADWSAYKTARQRWQKCNRDSIKTFYKSKGMSDFKNTKKFWQFYKSSIRLKSDIQGSECPNIIKDNDSVEKSPEAIANLFNSFFTSIKSSSMIQVDKASQKIFKQFK